MGLGKAQKTLGKNLTTLMKSQHVGAPTVQKLTEAIGVAIGRTTVARIKNGVANPELRSLEALASVFKKQTWQLLHPDLSDAVENLASDQSLDKALEVVAKALQGKSREKREIAAERLRQFALSPDSATGFEDALFALIDAAAEANKRDAA